MSDTSTITDSSLLRKPRHELVLRLRNADGESPPVRLASAKCTIGSSEGCTLRVRADGVEPLHCLILRGPRQTVVRRWSRHTQLNGRPFADAPLKPGDWLGIGPYEFEVLAGIESAIAECEDNRAASPCARPADPQPHGTLARPTAHAPTERVPVEPGIAELVKRLQRTAGPSRRRFRRLRDQLHTAQQRLEQSTAEVARQTCRIKELEDQLAQAVESLRERELHREQDASTLAVARQQVAEIQRLHDGAVAQREELNQEWSAAQAAWQAERGAWLSERDDWEAKGRAWESQRLRLTAEQERWESERAELESQRKALAADRAASQAEREASEVERQNFAAEHLALFDRQAAWQAQQLGEQAALERQAAGLRQESERLTALVDQLEQNRREFERKRAELAALESELRAKQAATESRQVELDLRATELDDRQEDLAAQAAVNKQREIELDAQRTELESQLAQCETRDAELCAQRGELGAQREELDRRRREFDAQADAFRAEYEQVRQKLDGQRAALEVESQEFAQSRSAWIAERQQESQVVASDRQIVAADAAQFVAEREALDAQRQSLAAAEHALADERRQLENKDRELTACRQALATERSVLEAERESMAAAREALDEARRQLASDQQQVAAQHQAAEARLRDLEEGLQTALAQSEAADAQRHAAEAELAQRGADASQRASQLAEQSAALYAAIEDFNRRQTAWETEQSQLAEKLTAGMQRCEQRAVELDSLQAEFESQRATWQAERERSEAGLASRTSHLERLATALEAETPAEDSAATESEGSSASATDIESDGSATASDAAGEEAIYARLRALSLMQDDLPPETDDDEEASLPVEHDGLQVPDEEPAAAANLPLADEEPAPSPHRPQETEQPQVHEEESIESYMARLLNRVGGHSTQPTPEPAAAPAAPRPVESRLTELRPSKVTHLKVVAKEAVQPTPAAVSEPEVQPLDASHWVARSAAPEKTVNLAAMRELANFTARRAIDKHAQGRWSRAAVKRLAAGLALLAVGGALVGGGLLKIPVLLDLTPAIIPWMHPTGVALCVAGLFWMFKAAITSRLFKHADRRAEKFLAGDGPKGKPDTAAPAEGS